MRIINVIIADANERDASAIIKIVEVVKPGCNFISEKSCDTILELIKKDNIDLIILDDKLFSRYELEKIIEFNIKKSKAYLAIFTDDEDAAYKIAGEVQCDRVFIKNEDYDIFCIEIDKFMHKLFSQAS